MRNHENSWICLDLLKNIAVSLRQSEYSQPMPNAFILYAELLDTSEHLESYLIEKNGILTIVAYIRAFSSNVPNAKYLAFGTLNTKNRAS